MQRWKSAKKEGEWEEIRLLGKGGQSEVFLVRSPARVESRRGHLKTLMELSGQGFDESRARRFGEAAWEYGRQEHQSELGALKLYNARPGWLGADEQALERLKIEIDVLNEGRTGLPKLLDYDKSKRWVATEFYAKGTLEDNLPKFAGDAQLSLTVFRSLVEIVAGLHKDEIVHRDVKPANVFLDASGRPILGDFGIAMPADQPARLTFTNESVGPWDYRPPWAEGGRLTEVTPTFDVYMLGKLLWCIVSGNLKLPREWYDRPDYDVTKRFPTDPHMHAINAILEKCLQDRPDKCLPNASELLLIVDSHLRAMQRGGQMLRDGVPRPCRVCGSGFYRPHDSPSGLPGTAVLLQWVTPEAGGRYAQPYRDQGAVHVQCLICDKCGHLQLFRMP